LKKGAEGTLGLIRKSLGFVENNDFGGRWCISKKEALHATFDKRIHLVSNRFEGTFIAAVEKKKAGKGVCCCSVQTGCKPLRRSCLSAAWGTKEEHVGTGAG